MKILKALALSSVMALCSTGANAELITTDYLTSNDSKATLDTETGIEWLDISQTKGMSINQVEGLLNSTFTGWRLPTMLEVKNLLLHAFPSKKPEIHAQSNAQIAYYDVTFNNEANTFANLFGRVDASAAYDLSAMLHKNDITNSVVRSGVFDRKSDNQAGLFFHQFRSADFNFTSVNIGVYLVSDGGITLSSINNPAINANNVNAPVNVPLPATAALLGLGLLGFTRRKDKKS